MAYINPNATNTAGIPYASIYPADCTYSNCSLATWGQLAYRPTFSGNLIYLILFALLMVAQIIIGIGITFWPLNRRFWRPSNVPTYGYMGAMVSGCILEIIGYAGRLMLWQDDFIFNSWLLYLICITLGPAFFSAAIYLCLTRIMAIYGTDILPSWFTQKRVMVSFVCCDFLALVLQSTGGALAATAAGNVLLGSIGRWIMVGGLGSQVLTMLVFVATCGWISQRYKNRWSQLNNKSQGIRQSGRLRTFFIALGVATVTILIRCAYRVAELVHGFQSGLANNESLFMILDGLMILIAVSALTLWHPGTILEEWWTMGNFHLRTKRARRLAGHSEVSSEQMEK